MKRTLRSNRIAAMVFATAVGLLAVPGCFWAPELSSIRRDIQDQLPGASFEKNVELSFGPAAIACARLVTGLVPGAREARPWLRNVSRVQVGVYDAHIGSAAELRMPRKLQSLIDDGWETAIRVRDDDQAVWVLYRADEESIREVFIVVLDDEELVIIKAKGRLERIVAAALDEAGGDHRFVRKFSRS